MKKLLKNEKGAGEAPAHLLYHSRTTHATHTTTTTTMVYNISLDGVDATNDLNGEETAKDTRGFANHRRKMILYDDDDDYVVSDCNNPWIRHRANHNTQQKYNEIMVVFCSTAAPSNVSIF